MRTTVPLLHTHQRTAARRDPTRTLALRTRFRGQMRRRWREVMRLVRQALPRLMPGESPVSIVLRPLQGTRDHGPMTIEQFMSWLRTTLTQTIQQPRRWWERLVRQGYDAGQRRGQRDAGVAEAGAPYGTPQALRPQTPAWQSLVTLVEERLTQLAESTAVAVREAVTRTFTGPLSGLASAVTQALETVGLRRGDTLTETSIVEAHAAGTLDALEQAGVTEVTLDAEYVRYNTARDDRVCFPAGTQVETECGPKPIQDMQVGDKVLTRAGYRRVTAVMTREYTGHMTQITAGEYTVTATSHHPFWTLEQGWLEAGQLDSGHTLHALNNEHVKMTRRSDFFIDDSDHMPSMGGDVYNMEIEQEHEYFANGLLVHNCQRCRPWEGIVLPIAQARSLIPQHPRCRCSFSAVRGVRARATRLAQRRRRQRLGGTS